MRPRKKDRRFVYFIMLRLKSPPCNIGADLHGTTFSHATSLRLACKMTKQNWNLKNICETCLREFLFDCLLIPEVFFSRIENRRASQRKICFNFKVLVNHKVALV